MSIPLLKMDNKSVTDRFKYFNEGSEVAERKVKLKECIMDGEIDKLDEANFETLCDIVDSEFKQIMNDRNELRTKIIKKTEDEIAMPINMERILWTTREKFNIRTRI